MISGGFGIFYDNLASGFVDAPNGILANPPVSVAIRVRPAAGTLPFRPQRRPRYLGCFRGCFQPE